MAEATFNRELGAAPAGITRLDNFALMTGLTSPSTATARSQLTATMV
jgi:hypothetical protein